MKKLIVSLIVFILIIPSAFADFVDDFNRNAEIYNVEKLQSFKDEEGSIFYMSGFMLLYYENGIVSIMGTDPVKTLAVGCCAADCVNQKESADEICGRLFRTYLSALEAEDHRAYSTYQGNYIKILIEATDEYVRIGLSK